MVLAVAAATFLLVQAVWGGLWRPWLLGGSALLYIGYVVYLVRLVNGLSGACGWLGNGE